MVLDVSETGMALATALPMPEAQTLNIAIPSDQPHQLIEVRGTIVWISDSKRRVGVQLLDPSPASRDFLRKWVCTVLERKLSGAPEPVENNFSYFSPASIVENCAPLPLRSKLNEGKTGDDIDPLLDSFVAALRQKPQSRKSLLIMNAANAATNGRVPTGDTAEKFAAVPTTGEPRLKETPADVVNSDAALTPSVSVPPTAYDSSVVSDPLPPSPQFSEQQVPQPQTFTEQPWLPTNEDAPVEDVPVDEDVRIDFDAQPEEVSSVASQMAPDALPEHEEGVAADVGMIGQHADLEPPARKIADHPVAPPPSEPKPRPRAAPQAVASRNISPFRALLLLAASAIIVASFAIGIGIGRSFWRRHASVAPNSARATVAQQTSVTPTPVTPAPVTPTPKTSPPSALTPSQTSSEAVGTNGATSSATSHTSGSGSPAPAAAPPGKKDGASPAVTAASAGMLVTPGEGDTPLRVDLPEEAVLVSAPLEIRSQRFAYVPGMGTNHHGKVRKERLIFGERESPKTPQIPTPPAGTSAAQSGERIVTVRATIDGDGHVTYVDPLNGPIVLIPNVMTAVREWHYKPSSLDGQPVQTEADLTIKFRTTR
jgi:PilZ domain/Gram-negative bacterial TonB protein C-terminal